MSYLVVPCTLDNVLGTHVEGPQIRETRKPEPCTLSPLNATVLKDLALYGVLLKRILWPNSLLGYY